MGPCCKPIYPVSSAKWPPGNGDSGCSAGAVGVGYTTTLKHLQIILDSKDQITHYIPGHWNSELSKEGFKNRFESGFEKLKANFFNDHNKHLHTETEINNLGYYFIQQKNQPDNALQLFELNAG